TGLAPSSTGLAPTSTGLAPTSTGEGTSTGDEPPTLTPFVDVTEALGLRVPHVGGGSTTGQAWGDYDRDGWLDLVLTGGLGENHLLHNRGDGTFEAVVLDPGAALPGPAKGGATWADYDNDGWLDLYVCVLGPNALLHNERGVLVPVQAGVAHPGNGRNAAWADYDGDGWLDLYLVNAGEDPDVLYHGGPTGTFTDRSELVALPAGKPGFAATWVDYDDDGDLDLYVVNDHRTGNDLWRNDGPGPGGPSDWRFTNVSEATGAGLRSHAMGVAVGDYDADGDLDLVLSDIDRTNLLRNELDTGHLGFTEVADTAGIAHPSVNWGLAWLDYDLDGWLDLYLATLHPGPPELTNRLYRSRGDGTFEDISAGCGCDDPGWTWGVAAGDYDDDGGVDLVIGNRAAGYRLLHNEHGPQPGRHWLTVELRGAGPINRDAIGARVTVHTTDGRRLRAERRSGSSLGSGDMLPLHFGLGEAEVERVLVRWPDGSESVHEDVPTDATWVGTYAR
ncbi:MAG: CRTAC1 family protein, partial [Myxococcales bacterium]|nr:CRTAC1 family protein [Myxococcales bacterium]